MKKKYNFYKQVTSQFENLLLDITGTGDWITLISDNDCEVQDPILKNGTQTIK